MESNFIGSRFTSALIYNTSIIKRNISLTENRLTSTANRKEKHKLNETTNHENRMSDCLLCVAVCKLNRWMCRTSCRRCCFYTFAAVVFQTSAAESRWCVYCCFFHSICSQCKYTFIWQVWSFARLLVRLLARWLVVSHNRHCSARLFS